MEQKWEGQLTNGQESALLNFLNKIYFGEIILHTWTFVKIVERSHGPFTRLSNSSLLIIIIMIK